MQVGEGRTRCFWLEPTGMVRLSLRRFTHGLAEKPGGRDPVRRQYRACSAREPHVYESGNKYWPGCDASVWLDTEIPLRLKDWPGGSKVLGEVPVASRPKASDPRWPQVCARCREPFRRTDVRQVNQAEVYVRGDTGEQVAFRGWANEEMAGALYDAWWLHGRVVLDEAGSEHRYVGADGIALVAICPGGLAWEVDGPATGGGRWTRMGNPRDPQTLTVSPSIVAGKPGAPGTYHGFLQQGWFTDHIG